MDKNSTRGIAAGDGAGMNLQISYITNRLEPHVEWFFDSLHRECGGDYTDLNVLVVDFWLESQREATEDATLLTSKREHAELLHDLRPLGEWRLLDVCRRADAIFEKFKGADRHLCLIPCMPNVWSGPYRLPKENWWSICAMRNTAICHAPDGYIAFVDDRSVLMPGWLKCAREAMNGGYAAFGSYQKFENLRVEDGLVVDFGTLLGRDHRLNYTSEQGRVIPCSGQWCFGCGSVLPVEWALSVNGYDAACDGLSFEDVIFGLMLEKHGYDLRYDPRMMVTQDRTPGQLAPTFRRTDKGVSPSDKSHAILNMVRTGGRHTAPNYFGEGGIRALRQKILAGGEFPITQCPEADWYDGELLREMK